MRILLLLLLLLSQLFSLSKDEIIDNILISPNNIEYKEDFEEEHFKDNLYLKVLFHPKISTTEETFYLRINHPFSVLTHWDTKVEELNSSTFITINKHSKNIVIKLTNNHSHFSPEFFMYTQKEYNSIEKKEYLFYGISYGIIFCAFLYSMILFLYNHSKTFLYYSCFQLCSLSLLILGSTPPNFIHFIYSSIPFFDIIGQLTLIFAVLFNRSFLKLKRFFPQWDIVLKLLVFLLIIDIVFLLLNQDVFIFIWIPTSFVLFLLVVTSFLVYKQGYKIAIIYTIGWSTIVISVLIMEFDILHYPSNYILSIGLPLESLILSFTLGYRMRRLEDEKNAHEKMVVHQNKLAAMGEMINNIAHQYRQPLTHLGYILMNIKSAHEHQQLDTKYLNKKIYLANNQLQFMSDTIDNFRDFYHKSTQKETFNIKKAVQRATDIIKPVLEEHSIQLTIDIKDNSTLKGIENEYSQVILNLLCNAKDEMILSKQKNGNIDILLIQENNKKKLIIKDNGKGVTPEIQEKIFDPYFSTKPQSNGIGLYMSSLIIQNHFGGKLYVEPTEEGATFIIET